ncbi:hypothetical protein X772_20140 [Mesorhizobium sp. LSJC280B00]|nr:hypothetical protein X772_20140 [Mesorhizobium sp. LSJC280B00]
MPAISRRRAFQDYSSILVLPTRAMKIGAMKIGAMKIGAMKI